jgi:hypothetical protein
MKRKKKDKILRLGECYLTAFHAFMDLAIMMQCDDWLLCHGLAIGTGPLNLGKPFGHAWIESRDTVLDTGRPCAKKEYYELGKIGFVKRFTYKEAAAMAVKFRHYGPWAKEIEDAEAWMMEGLVTR